MRRFVGSFFCHPRVYFSMVLFRWISASAAATTSISMDALAISMGSTVADTLVIGDSGHSLSAVDVYAGNVVFHGDVSVAGTIINPIPSDSRLKCDVLDLRHWIQNASTGSSALSLVERLRPVTYHWNEIGKRVVGRRANDLDMGFLAQDVEAVFPFATSSFSFEGEFWKSMDYGRLTPLLAEAVKELSEV